MPSHPIAAAGLFLLGEEYLLLFMGLNSQYHDLTALRRIARPRSIVEPFSVPSGSFPASTTACGFGGLIIYRRYSDKLIL
jgi:hypothetical protein